jgi:hypothetical protein
VVVSLEGGLSGAFVPSKTEFDVAFVIRRLIVLAQEVDLDFSFKGRWNMLRSMRL